MIRSSSEFGSAGNAKRYSGFQFNGAIGNREAVGPNRTLDDQAGICCSRRSYADTAGGADEELVVGGGSEIGEVGIGPDERAVMIGFGLRPRCEAEVAQGRVVITSRHGCPAAAGVVAGATAHGCRAGASVVGGATAHG